MNNQNHENAYERWLNDSRVDDATKAELKAIANDSEAVKYLFFSDLTFGTAGLRGTMKAGTNAMNIYTVAHATQAFADLIISAGDAAMQRGVVIAYDCRNQSKAFAERSACVLAANGIQVYLFDALRPTPLLSFAIGHLHCIAGINITASHNPKEYNGYKAYWEDGAQISPAVADKISENMKKTDIFDDVKCVSYDEACSDGRIRLIGDTIDEAYLTEVQKQLINPDIISAAADKLCVVYSPLHGTGYRLVPEILKRAGMKNVSCVPEQMIIDGNFPTVEFPNPEYQDVFHLGIDIARQTGAELVIATDPDADRVGVVTKTRDGSFQTITGNQMGVLLLDYIITELKSQGRLEKDAYAIKSIVTTEMAAKVCAMNGIAIFNVFTGFKNIGEKIDQMTAAGNRHLLLGYEESYGYLRGNYARDKDAVVATMLICEMAAHYTILGKNLYDALQELYQKYGYFVDGVENIYMQGLDGIQKMKDVMQRLRTTPPVCIGESPVKLIYDYLACTVTAPATGKVLPTQMASTNVLSYVTEAGDTIVIRPSGTEPKIKIYILVGDQSKEAAEAKTEIYRRTALTWVK